MRVLHVSEVLVFSSEFSSLVQLGYEKYDGSECVLRYMEGISETIEAAESPIVAASRGLLEELGLEIDLSRLLFADIRMETKESPSTRVMTQYHFYKFAVFLSEAESAKVRDKISQGLREKKGILYLKFV